MLDMKGLLNIASAFLGCGLILAMARSNDELFKDSVGDVIVTLIILSMQKGTNVQECLEMAYNEIKGRTGKMVDGVFVKSSDLWDSK